MEVTLIQHSNLSTCVKAIRTCWQSQEKGGCYPTPTDDIIEADRKLIDRIVNKNSHKSTAEHLVYTFDIDGISRACLQELARHRMASYSVKSTRYTLKELKDKTDSFMEFLVSVNDTVDTYNCIQLKTLAKNLRLGAISNDKAKYLLPEAYKTSLVMTINARSLQNFLELRSSKSALWEIRELALNIYKAIPEEHKYLFEESIKDKQ